MAQDLVETSVQAEGSDDLRTFLVKYKSELKLTNATKLNGLYDKLSEEIGYDDMIELTEQDLRPSLSDCGLKSIQIGRIIAILKKIPESAIYKHENAIKVVAISTQEDDALNNIKKAAEKIDEIINNITINIDKLDENSKKCVDEINANFDDIIKTANKRRAALLLQLTNMTETKQNTLTIQQTDLKSHKKALNECYEKSQVMVRDLNMDKEKRKKKILSTTNELLKNGIIDSFKLATNVTVEFNINMNNINKALSTSGSIQSKDIPLPPVINVESKKDRSAIIGIVSIDEQLDTKGIEYKLEYCQHDDDDDDMKIDWTAITIKYQQNVEYEMKSLKPLTSYNIRASLRNKYGWSGYCDNISFQTKKQIIDHDKFDSNLIAKDITLNGNVVTHTGKNNADRTSFCTNVVMKGLHHWRFRVKKLGYPSDCWMTLGIWKTNSGTPPKEGYFLKSGHGYGYLIGHGYCAESNAEAPLTTKYGVTCKVNDVIDMYLDFRNLTLKYSVNGTDYGVARNVENTSYRAAIGTFHKNDSIEIVQYSCQ